MSVAMALVDYIPVALFLAGAVILQRTLYSLMSKGAFALFSAGTITVFVAGLFKATWKLLYAAGICDFAALNKCFFPMQTTGFVLAGLGMIALICHKQGKNTMYAAAPPVFASSMPFVFLMVFGVAAMDVCLCIVAKRRKHTLSALLYILSFMFTLAMGYLSSKDFAEASMNWIAEGVNTVGQLLFFLGAYLMREKKQTAKNNR